jgi:two-component system LytT family response regulator
MNSNVTCIIIDDEQHAIDMLTAKLSRLYKSITIVATFTFWEEAIDTLRTNKCDLLMLDIFMPEKNGIELLQLLPNLDCEIIFVTAHDNFAIEAFMFNTSGYLLKPISDKELSIAVDRALNRIQNKHSAPMATLNPVSERLAIPNNNGIDYIAVNDILYLEGLNKYTRIVTAKSEFISSLNLGKFNHLITKHSFFQVHRSYIVNLKSILRYESAGILILQNKKEIPVSRNLRMDLLGHIKNGF